MWAGALGGSSAATAKSFLRMEVDGRKEEERGAGLGGSKRSVLVGMSMLLTVPWEGGRESAGGEEGREGGRPEERNAQNKNGIRWARLGFRYAKSYCNDRLLGWQNAFTLNVKQNHASYTMGNAFAQRCGWHHTHARR